AHEANLATPIRVLRRDGESEGEPKFHPRRILELWRHHAYDSDSAVVDRDLLIDDVRITAEAPLPQRMTQHDDLIASFRVISLRPFFGGECSPERRFHSEHVHVIGRHIHAHDWFRLAAARKVHRYSIEDRSGKLREAPALLAIVQKISRRDTLLFVGPHPSAE